jgi:hypothetical protein
VPAVSTYVFGLIYQFNYAKPNTILHERSQKLVVITSHIYNPSAALAMAQHTANNIGVTLFPPPLVLFDFPSINDISH